MDEPTGDAAFFPTFLLSQYAKKKVSVVLAGEGSDEIFGGYKRYQHALTAKKLSVAAPLFRLAKKIVPLRDETRLGRLFAMCGARSFEQTYFETIALFGSKELKKLRPGITIEYPHFEKTSSLKKMLLYDQQTVLPSDFLVKSDRMSMGFALEERCPFLNHDLVAFANSLPDHFKMSSKGNKLVLRKAVSDILPPSISARKKRGYNAPMDDWLKNDLYAVAQSTFESADKSLYSSQVMLEKLKRLKTSKDHYEGNYFLSQQVWSMLMFEMWKEKYLS